MRLHHVAVRITGLAILAAVAACSDTGPTTGPAPTSLLRPQQAPDMASLTRALPGFGGLFIDHGVPTVYLTDLRQQGLAEQLLGGFARAVPPASVFSRDALLMVIWTSGSSRYRTKHLRRAAWCSSISTTRRIACSSASSQARPTPTSMRWRLVSESLRRRSPFAMPSRSTTSRHCAI